MAQKLGHLRKTRRHRITNTSIRKDIRQEPVTTIIERKELRCIGHLVRINKNKT